MPDFSCQEFLQLLLSCKLPASICVSHFSILCSVFNLFPFLLMLFCSPDSLFSFIHVSTYSVISYLHLCFSSFHFPSVCEYHFVYFPLYLFRSFLGPFYLGWRCTVMLNFIEVARISSYFHQWCFPASSPAWNIIQVFRFC